QIDAVGPPAVAAPVVDPEVRYDRLAVVAIQPRPRREVRILAHRRPAPSARITIGLAQLAQGAAEMERPRVVECGMRVGLERSLLGQPRRGPVLPPVKFHWNRWYRRRWWRSKYPT